MGVVIWVQKFPCRHGKIRFHILCCLMPVSYSSGCQCSENGRRKIGWERMYVDYPQKTKPQFVTPEGNVLLWYQLWDKTTSQKSALQAKALQKRPQFRKTHVTGYLAKVYCHLRCTAWLQGTGYKECFLKSVLNLRIIPMCKVRRHPI